MDTVLLEITNQIAKITLNRPHKFNAISREMALELNDILDRVAKEETVRAVVLTGAGKAFCSGQDLTEVKDTSDPKIINQTA